MKTVQQLADEIISREGGYVNDPDDPGGATNFGVTIGKMREMGLDLTGDGRVTEEDVKALTRERAREIFLEEYFQKPRLHLLPPDLQPPVFDMQVNAGSNAVRILQRLLVTLGYDLEIDGKMGPQTARAAHAAAHAQPNLVNMYGAARREYYYAIGDRRPASRKYATTRSGTKGGWIKRAEEFMTPAMHFTQAEHNARIRGWT